MTASGPFDKMFRDFVLEQFKDSEHFDVVRRIVKELEYLPPKAVAAATAAISSKRDQSGLSKETATRWVHEKVRFEPSKNRDSLSTQIDQNSLPTSSSTTKPKPKSKSKPKPKPVFTSTKQIMNYVTIKGIESDTSYIQYDWPVFCLKELMDNLWDFYCDNYPDNPKSDRIIIVRVWADEDKEKKIGFIHINVRGSNVNKIPVFENLEATFDYSQWYSSKRDQYGTRSGSLGDALKRINGMGYAKWTQIDVGGGGDGDSFEAKQWNQPLILRFNGKEYRIFIRVEEFSQDPVRSEIQGPFESQIAQDLIETEVTLPISIIPDEHCIWDEYRSDIHSKLSEYYKTYKIAKSRINFAFDWKGLLEQ